MCKFFVFPGNGQALLGMLDIDTLNIIHVKCNTIDAQETDGDNNCSTNTAICQSSRHEQHYTNMIQKAEMAKKCYGYTDNIQNLIIKISQWLFIKNLTQ